MSETEDIKTIISGILDVIDDMKSNLEYGYSWKDSFLKELDISKKMKKELGYDEEYE